MADYWDIFVSAYRVTADFIHVFTAQIKKAESKLVQLNNELENKVRERTIQLEEINAGLKEEICERQKIEQELKASAGKLSKVFHSSPCLMSLNRKSDLLFLDVNQRLLDFGKMEYTDIIGKTPWEIGLPDKDIHQVVELLDKQCSFSNLEFGPINQGNISGTLIMSAELIEIDGEDCVLFASIDITELQRIREELTRLDRLRLVGQMAAGIGHEIRNPMTTVRVYLQLMGAKTEFQPQKSSFDLMISELDRANWIITEFLSLAKIKPTERVSQNLNDILKNVYPLIEADTFVQNNKILFIPGEIPDLPLNSKEIIQMVLNLSRNGLEAMEENGCLTIQTYLDKHNVVLSIKDEGCGIPPDTMNKLGTPFFTTKDNGTGLGLAICYRIAEAHNASINVESSLSGTTFVVTFYPPALNVVHLTEINRDSVS